MAARGYGTGRRTQFSRFSFTKGDVILILMTVVLIAPTIISLATGGYDTVFYPYFVMAQSSVRGTVGYITFAILAMMPVVADITESIRWKCLVSKI